MPCMIRTDRIPLDPVNLPKLTILEVANAEPHIRTFISSYILGQLHFLVVPSYIFYIFICTLLFSAPSTVL